jgi:hypothetical protein
MANTSRVNGLSVVKNLTGGASTGQINRYFIPSGNATAVFIGDPVKADATGDTAAAGGLALGVQSCIQAAAGDAILGVVVGFAVDPTNLNTPQYRAASTGRYVLVSDDPNQIYEVQTSNGTLAVADVGLNASIAVAAGSTSTGASGVTLDVGTAATTATLALRIVGFVQRPDNDNTAASSKVLVKINNSQLGASTGTAGV